MPERGPDTTVAAWPMRVDRRRWLQQTSGVALGALIGAPLGAMPLPPGVHAYREPAVVPRMVLQGLDGRWQDPVRAALGRLVLLQFWATWCEPCQVEMPQLAALADRLGEACAVVAVNAGEPPSRIRRFVEASGWQHPVWCDPHGDCRRAWGVRIYPNTVVLDRTGRPRARVVGEWDWTSAPVQAWLSGLLG